MNGEPPSERPARPLIPIIILGGLALLILTSLAFMVHFVREEAHRRSLRTSAPPAVATPETNHTGETGTSPARP